MKVRIFFPLVVFFIFFSIFLFPKNVFAYDYCTGTVNNQQTAGICYYSTKTAPYYTSSYFNAHCDGDCSKMPGCSQITDQNLPGETFQDSTNGTGCSLWYGNPVHCCIPNDKKVFTQSADKCEGYQSGSRIIQQGVCLYEAYNLSPQYTINSAFATVGGNGGIVGAPSFQFPNCTDMTQYEFNDPHYHAITDEIKACFGGDIPTKCCASDTQNPVAPPPPCNLDKPIDKGGNCISVTTGFGDINIEIGSFVQSLFTILLSISGGIAILILIYNGYVIMTSQGEAEKLKGAREAITAAIIGLVFMIFSVAILKIIGVDILRIPDFLGFR